MTMRAGMAFVCLTALAQTLPRPAAPFEFTLARSKGMTHLSGYKGRVVVLYVFSPN